MTSHNSTAKAVRLAKQAHPERYCITPRCLHRAPCPKHSTEKPRFDYSRTCECGAPYDNDLQGFSCAD